MRLVPLQVLLREVAAYEYSRKLVAACYDTVEDFDELVRNRFELLRTEFGFAGGHLKKLIAYRQTHFAAAAVREATEQHALVAERQQLQRAKTQARLAERRTKSKARAEPEPEPEPEPECVHPEQDRGSASALWRKHTALPSIAQLASAPMGEWSAARG